jgi:hypothetical protein
MIASEDMASLRYIGDVTDPDGRRPAAKVRGQARRPERRATLAKAITLAASVATVAAGVVAVLTFLRPSPSPVPTSSPAQTPSKPVPQAFKVASPDLEGYCAGIRQGHAHLNIDDHQWRCSVAPYAVVNLDSACQETNRNRTAHASTANFFTGAVDCWNVSFSFGAPRFEAYCRQKGYSGAENTDSTAYGWRCSGAPGSIYVSSVCQWQLGSPETTAIFNDFTDKDSWRCWG